MNDPVDGQRVAIEPTRDHPVYHPIRRTEDPEHGRIKAGDVVPWDGWYRTLLASGAIALVVEAK